MAWFSDRWVNVAVLDTLLKRLFTLMLSIAVTFGVFGLLAALLDAEDARRKSVLRLVLILGVWIIVEAIRFIVHTLRAAFTGRFLDEYAAQRADKAQSRAASSPAAAVSAAGSTATYQGEDPAATVPLSTRIVQVTAFYVTARRWPDPSAAPGTDEYFHGRTIAELEAILRSPEAPKSARRDERLLNSMDKSQGWRDRYR